MGILVSNFKSVADQVPACPRCVCLIKSNDWKCNTHPVCEHCVNWDTSRLSSTIKLSHKYLCTQLSLLNNTMAAEDSPPYSQLKILTKIKGMNEAAGLKIDEHFDNIKRKNSLLSDIDLPTDGRFKKELRDKA
jgi:hypothetical protein